MPARFCAPLAGYTHSAFRRLISELGGCGALWTEMLASRQILSEPFNQSPWLRRRANEGPVFYQLMVREGDPLDRILPYLAQRGVECLDLNMACDAKSIRVQSAGSGLFSNLKSMQAVLQMARQHWPGLLSAKIRLGSFRPDWRDLFVHRIRCLEDSGVDALIVHPRFFDDKFKRRAQHELIPWIRSLTQLPLIVSGDISQPDQVQSQSELHSAQALMIGRMALVRPWIFAAWDKNLTVDYLHIWQKMFEYIAEDFTPVLASSRIKMFAKYYAANFTFGHQFHVAVANAATLKDIHHQAEDFLSRNPATNLNPSVAGL